jgi:glucose-6-phosphate dehydrogenase assembly protein OpcA
MSSVVSEKTAVESFLSGQLTQVDVARIERELRKFWADAAGGPGAPGANTVIRACTFNLVMITSEDDAETKAGDVLDEVVAHHPARAILAIYRPGKERRLDAWVSARCHLQGANKQICSEQITVLSEGCKPQELTSVVIPLLLPDLPVFLWWKEPTMQAELLTPLKNVARRLIVDSARTPFDVSFLANLARMREQSNGSFWVTDLNWRRIGGWCRSLANAFDGFPLDLEYLFRLSKINISYAGGASDGPSAQALLLSGWLAGRLTWQPGSPNAASSHFKGPDGTPIEIAYKPVKHDFAPPGSIVALECLFDDKVVLTLNLECTADEAQIVASTVSPEERQEIESVHFHASEAFLIGQEVEMPGPDRVFEESLTTAAKLLPRK